MNAVPGPQSMVLSVDPWPACTLDYPAGTHVSLRSVFKCAALLAVITELMHHLTFALSHFNVLSKDLGPKCFAVAGSFMNVYVYFYLYLGLLYCVRKQKCTHYPY